MLRDFSKNSRYSLKLLPCRQILIKMFMYRYEKSYMHRDVVTHVAVSQADFFITGSTDGKMICMFGSVCMHASLRIFVVI